MTLAQALDLAMRQNLGLAASREDVQSKLSTESAEFREMLPKLSMTSSRTDMVANNASGGSQAESYNTTVKLAQTLYSGGALVNTWKRAELSTEQSRLTMQRTLQGLAYDVKAAWYEILKNAFLYKEAQSSVERLRLHARNAQAFYKEGKYWRNDVLQANVKLAQGEQKEIETENDLTVAKARLNRILRRSLDEGIQPQGELEFQPFQWKLEEAFQQALAQRPDLQKGRLDIDKARLDEKITAAEYQPSLSLSAEQAWDAKDDSYRKSDNSTKALVTLSWTAFEWGKTVKEVESLRHTSRKSDLTFEESRDKVLLEVKEAFLTAQESAKKMDVLKQALEQAEENFRVNQIRYREQLGNATDVLNALDLLTTTRNSYITALAAYLTALAGMDKAVGVLPDGAAALLASASEKH